MSKPPSKARMAKMVALTRTMNDDPDVRAIVMATCVQRGVQSVGHLASSHPKVFDELVEVCDDLLEQAPAEERPGFLR